MGKFSFCEQCVYLERRPISFEGRPYLPAIYAADDRYLVLRCSRQTEKSTFLVNTILYEASINPGIQILFVSPRYEQARVFVRTRLLTSLEQSPLIRRKLLGRQTRRPQISNMEFANGSTLFVRAAFHSGDACRGISAQLLLVDEYQDAAAGDLPILEETMSHAARPRTILTGTPKTIDNHLETAFRRYSANEWTMTCPKCSKGVTIDERALGPTSVICPDCAVPLDPRNGTWVPRNPESMSGQSFSINYAMTPWSSYEDLQVKQQTYDIFRFKNEVLGLSTTTGDHVVTRAELEACCTDKPMAENVEQVPPQGRPKLVAGIDWGGGGVSRTVLVIGFMRSDFKFQICRMERFAASEDPDRVLTVVAQRCAQFRVRFIAADGGGNGSVLNRLLVDPLRPQHGLFAMIYAPSRHEPRQEGVLWKWMIDRTASIGVLFSRVKKQTLLFPRVVDSGSFLEEFACEVAEYDDINRMVKYSHPETMQDDCLHATNYALTLAVYTHSAERRSVDDCQ
jgi:hypothetical protein